MYADRDTGEPGARDTHGRVHTCRSVSSHEDSTELYMLYYDPQTRSDRGLRQGAAARRQYTAPHVQS